MHNYKWWSVFNKTTLVLLTAVSFSATAVVNIDRTRIIFHAEQNTQSINLINSGVTPTVVQVWSDSGDINSSPEESHAPVMAFPPVMKMAPGELKSLRLMLTSRSGLPTDKESIYWLNIYQIPAQTDSQGRFQQKVLLPLRIRLKIFIRPESINNPDTYSGGKLHFIKDGSQMIIENPTPWYMNINSLNVHNENLGNILLPPKDHIDIHVKKQINQGDGVSYSIINDEGNTIQYKGIITLSGR